MSKQNANLTALGQIQADTEAAYLSAPKLAAPNTQITTLDGAARQLRDPSQTLRPNMGSERIHPRAIQWATGEKGPNGEAVWRMVNGEDRIRFVGNWIENNDTNSTSIITSTISDFVEITFWGTGLNLVNVMNASARDVRASVDGGSEGANLLTTASAVISARNPAPNNTVTVTSGLTLGIHTVKLRLLAVNFAFQGVEILGNTGSISIPKGEIVVNGRKEVIGAATTTAYDSGYDGSPTLNGRGGHVVVYAKDGQIRKVIQQTNASQANVAAADHTNEEVIRKIHFREFGMNRADDFSTLTTSSDRAFSLDNNSTTLIGNDVIIDANIGEAVAVAPTVGYMTINFTGTGLDVIIRDDRGSALARSFQAITVDGGATIGSISYTAAVTDPIHYTQKVVSGLPYGTHSVSFLSNAGAANSPGIEFFLVYGPKKPTVPDGAVQVGEYYLPATFAAGATAGRETIATGVVRKSFLREFVYVGTWTATLDIAEVNGYKTSSTTTNDYWEYVFYGTGFEHRFGNNATTVTWQYTVDGSTNISGFTTSTYGAGITSLTTATGTLVTSTTATVGNGVRVSGLSLGVHKVRFTKTAGTGTLSNSGFDTIVPIHFPATKTGSLSMNPAKNFPNTDTEGDVELGKAAAWLYFDGVNSNVLKAYNIAAVLKRSTGKYQVFFTKPFKDNNYVVIGTADIPTNNFQNCQIEEKKPSYCLIGLSFTTTGGASDDGLSAAFFGELIEDGDP